VFRDDAIGVMCTVAWCIEQRSSRGRGDEFFGPTLNNGKQFDVLVRNTDCHGLNADESN
jgi:hypothetical protein